MNLVQPIRDTAKIELIKDMLRYRSRRDYFLFVMGINTGLRISDILNLKVSDVKDKTHIVLHEKKTGKAKRFKINRALQAELEQYINGMEPEQWLFPSKRNEANHLDRVQAYRILNDVAKEAGLDEIGTHTLRKSFGYHFYKKTKDVALLQELFNHSAPSVTLRYIGINQDIIDEAIDDFHL
jgi:integrase